MSNDPLYLLAILSVSTIGTLPFTFFRRGHLNARWLLTASPICLSGCSVLATWLGLLHRGRQARA